MPELPARSLRQARHRGLQVPRHHDRRRRYTQFEDKPTFDEVEVLANRYLDEYVTGKLDRLDVAYTQVRVSIARQQVVVETLLPLGDWHSTSRREPSRSAAAAESMYEFLPSAESILEEVVPTSFKVKLFKCFLDAAVSEQIARMVAMKAATENAGDLIKQLEHALQPRPPRPDHARDHGNHRRRRSAEVKYVSVQPDIASRNSQLDSLTLHPELKHSTMATATATASHRHETSAASRRSSARRSTSSSPRSTCRRSTTP